MRKGLALMIGLLLIGFVQGYGETVTLEFMTSGPGIPQEIAAFEKIYPYIKVKQTGLPFEQFFPAVETRLGAGEPTPDVLMVDEPTIASYALRGFLLPVEDFITDEDMADYLPASIKSATYGDHIYTFPWWTSTQLLFYNVDMFQEAGIEPPPPDPDQRWTWKKVVEVALKLTKDVDGDGKIDQWGFAFEQVDRPYQLLPLPQSLGAAVIGPDGLTATGYVNSDLFVEAMRFYYDIYNTWKISPKGLRAFETRDAFAAGRIAMLIGGAWNLHELPQMNPELNFGVAPHPYFERGKPVTPTGSWHIGVNANTKHPKEAILLARFITSQAMLCLRWKLTAALPARKTVYFVFPEEFETYPGTLIFYELENTAVPRPRTVGYVEYEEILRQAFADIRAGVDPKEALDRAATLIDQRLAKYRQLLELKGKE